MNIMQALHDLQLNPFGAVLLAESFLKSPLAERVASKCEPLAFNLPVDRSDCAAWAGVRFTLTPVKAGEDAPALDAKDTEIARLKSNSDSWQAGAKLDREVIRQQRATLAIKDMDIAALTAERDHWKANHDAQVQRARLLVERTDMPVERVKAYELVTSLTAERDALRKDAGRYQLLRRGQQWSVIDGIGDVLRAERLDAAIDAAMSKEPK
jgi:hypothetical protein